MLRANLEGQALGVLARALLTRDGPAAAPQAGEAIERAAELIERTGARTLAPSLLEWRAMLATVTGDPAAGVGLMQQAAALYDEIGAPYQGGRVKFMLMATPPSEAAQ
jgi:hypothetical protein